MTLGIITARGGSKSIPQKNYKPLNGIPLIAYTIAAANASNLDRVIVSTEDPDIAKIATQYGAEVLMRPLELAQDTTPTRPVLQHCVATLEGAFDSVMTLQPTSPFRTADHINEALQHFHATPDADALVSIVKIPHSESPTSAMRYDGTWVTPYLENEPVLLRRQDKPIFYARNAAIYLTKTTRLSEYIFGGKTLGYEMSKLASLDIDDPDDWTIAEAVARHINFMIGSQK